MISREKSSTAHELTCKKGINLRKRKRRESEGEISGEETGQEEWGNFVQLQEDEVR